MVLIPSKRSNAGKAPARLDDAALSTPPPSAQPKPSKKASRIPAVPEGAVSVFEPK
jgi:hypothetical protein